MLDPETQAAVDEIWRLFRETSEQFKETDTRFKETEAIVKETSASLRRLEGLFGSQWGKLIEALVQPNALKIFRERGIQVHYVNRRVLSQRNGQSMEVDLILENDLDVIVIEVKSTLKIENVNEFLDDLAEFLHFFPKYAGRRIYGAVAGLNIEENADRYAYRRGLFVLGVTGEGMVRIINDAKFRPHDFASNSV
ncbi:MAG: hypothetical protein U0350_08570 [Caldilineaceae bacterium]